jgi:hypothetical protein
LYTIHTYSRNGSKRRRKNDRYQWDNKNKYIDAQGEKQGVSEKPMGFEGKERVLSLEIPGYYVIYPPPLPPLSLSASKLTRQGLCVKKVSGNGVQIKRIIIITIIEFVTGKSHPFGRNEKLKSRARNLKIRKK